MQLAAPGGTFKIADIITNSSFAILGLILGFTYSMAVGRFEGRRQLVINEANSISTAFLRGHLLRTDQVRLKSLYVQYLDARIRAYENYNDPEKYKVAKEDTFRLQLEIWDDFEKLAETERGALESAYVYALNEMLDMEFARTISLEKNLPTSIYWIIMLIACVTLGLLNFDRGYANERAYLPMFFFILLFTVVVCLILDLDRPHSGLIQIGQDAMYALRVDLIRE